jgi:hypothetical protein
VRERFEDSESGSVGGRRRVDAGRLDPVDGASAERAEEDARGADEPEAAGGARGEQPEEMTERAESGQDDGGRGDAALHAPGVRARIDGHDGSVRRRP